MPNRSHRSCTPQCGQYAGKIDLPRYRRQDGHRQLKKLYPIRTTIIRTPTGPITSIEMPSRDPSFCVTKTSARSPRTTAATAIWRQNRRRNSRIVQSTDSEFLPPHRPRLVCRMSRPDVCSNLKRSRLGLWDPLPFSFGRSSMSASPRPSAASCTR